MKEEEGEEWSPLTWGPSPAPPNIPAGIASRGRKVRLGIAALQILLLPLPLFAGSPRAVSPKRTGAGKLNSPTAQEVNVHGGGVLTHDTLHTAP